MKKIIQTTLIVFIVKFTMASDQLKKYHWIEQTSISSGIFLHEFGKGFEINIRQEVFKYSLINTTMHYFSIEPYLKFNKINDEMILSAGGGIQMDFGTDKLGFPLSHWKSSDKDNFYSVFIGCGYGNFINNKKGLEIPIEISKALYFKKRQQEKKREVLTAFYQITFTNIPKDAIHTHTIGLRYDI